MKRLAPLLAVLALVLSGCFFTPLAMNKNVDLIFEVDFSQSQAVPGFDDDGYTLQEYSPELKAFQALLKKHDIEPWNYSSPDTGGCAGGITTNAYLMYHSAGDDTMVIDGCGAKEGSFEAEATELFSSYREAHQQFPLDGISAVEFWQTQAVQGFDDSVHRQEDPEQIARFRDLLFQYGVKPGEYPDGTPCPGSIATNITVEYANESTMPVMYLDSCTDDGGFSAAATDLFSEWREGS